MSGTDIEARLAAQPMDFVEPPVASESQGEESNDAPAPVENETPEAPAVPVESDISAEDKEDEKTLENKEETDKSDEEKSLDEIPLPDDEKEEPKKKELPKWVEKKMARANRELAAKEAELAAYRNVKIAQAAQIPVVAIEGSPVREQFENEADYINAVIDHRDAVRAQSQQKAAEQQAFIAANEKFKQKLDSVKEKGDELYEGFTDKVDAMFHGKDFPPNRAMAETIVSSPYSVEISHFLASNLPQALKIAQMNPIEAVKELTKLEMRFDAQKNRVKKSAAPPPITPVNTNSPKSAMGTALSDLDRIAKGGSQRDFETAFKKMQKSNPFG